MTKDGSHLEVVFLSVIANRRCNERVTPLLNQKFDNLEVSMQDSSIEWSLAVQVLLVYEELLVMLLLVWILRDKLFDGFLILNGTPFSSLM